MIFHPGTFYNVLYVRDRVQGLDKRVLTLSANSFLPIRKVGRTSKKFCQMAETR